MSQQFLLPDLGEGLTEAEIVSWLVAPGDIVVVDQLVVEVESAKSIVELPSPFGGRVERLDAAAGQIVQKGSSLLTISELIGSELTSSEPASSGPADTSSTVGAAPRTAEDTTFGHAMSRSGSGAVLVGYGTKESTMRLARPAGGRFGSRGSLTQGPGTASIGAERSVDPGASALLDPARRSPVASPIVRARARVHGFDASHLAGTGPGSLVRRNDVEAAIVARAAASAEGSNTGRDEGAGDRHIPLVGMRRLIASRLSESRRVVPEVTLWLDVDVSRVLEAKDRLLRVTGEAFSLTSLVARFAVAGLQRFPVLNSSVVDVEGGGQEIIQHASINLGIAAQTPRGLMVPVVHGTQSLTTRELRDGISALVEASKTATFAPAALSGGTFTLNNYGSFGVDGSTPIINHPEVAMLGLGRIMERPWVVDHQLAVRTVMVLSFVFDHRVCDGDVASGFLTFVAGCIEEPLALLGDL